VKDTHGVGVERTNGATVAPHAQYGRASHKGQRRGPSAHARVGDRSERPNRRQVIGRARRQWISWSHRCRSRCGREIGDVVWPRVPCLRSLCVRGALGRRTKSANDLPVSRRAQRSGGYGVNPSSRTAVKTLPLFSQQLKNLLTTVTADKCQRTNPLPREKVAGARRKLGGH
jgi:hypothetical protein